MFRFSYTSPTVVHFGTGQIGAIAQEIPKNARVLMIYGKGSIKKNGVYDQVSKSLSDVTWFEFSGIEPNPNYDTLMDAVALVKEHNINFLLAVGGGSVIDGTKFIAAAACYLGEDPWEILANKAPVNQALPSGVILTLAATGTETNQGSVISRGHEKLVFESPLVRPRFAILDPSTQTTLSDRQVGNGVVDAFVHTIEQYLTYPINAKVQDRFAEGVLRTLIEEGPKFLKNREDQQASANIMWAASVALNGILGVGVPSDWSSHEIGIELTALYQIDHARTLSIILPAVMKVFKESKSDKLLQYVEQVWGVYDGSREQRLDIAIKKTEDFFQLMGLPIRLKDVDLDEHAIEALTAQIARRPNIAFGEHQSIHLDECVAILKAALA